MCFIWMNGLKTGFKMPNKVYNIQGNLSDQEWQELLGLEYVLTWRYTDDIEGDTARYKELVEKKYQEAA